MTRESERSPQKISVKKEIFSDSQDVPFKWKDLKHIDFQDDDELIIQYEEGFYSENNSWDGGFTATVIRTRPETDEEFEKRKEENVKFKEELRQRRYQNYLELKKEFEK